MVQKTATFVVLALLLGAGFLLGSFFGGFIGQLTVPASHKNIVDDMKITVFGNPDLTLTCTYLSTAKSKWQLSTLQQNFVQHGTYQYSLWVYSYEGDPEVTACIWGPGEDGKTYQVELSAFWIGRSYMVKQGDYAPITFTGSTYFAVEVA